MAADELMELLLSVYEESGGPSGTQPKAIANALRTNRDVMLRALGGIPTLPKSWARPDMAEWLFPKEGE